MDRHPFDEYLEALEHFRDGDPQKAAEVVTSALGGDRVTPAISSSIDTILDRGSILHTAILGVLDAEVRRRAHARSQ